MLRATLSDFSETRVPAKRKAMRKIRDVLRLKHEAALSHERIAAATGLSKGAVTQYLQRAVQAGIGWPLPKGLDDDQLEARLFRRAAAPPGRHAEPDYARMHQALKRRGVTLQLLWEEYHATEGERAYRYSQFCERYRRFAATLKRSMRQIHRAGDKLFIDYSGVRAEVIDGMTGEIRRAELFVAVLGASQYAYVEATWTQQLPDWIASHVRCFEYLGAVPALLVPDNLKSAIKQACRYEPEATSTYADLATHYATAILPARPRHPKDKPLVEGAVLLTQRWILARLRHQQFFSLADLNAAIRPLLDDLNRRPFKKLDGCRRGAFEALDRPAMKALPAQPYEYAEWKPATVNIDYHVEVDRSFYSVPHTLVRQRIEVRVTAVAVECFHKGQRVAVHARVHKRGSFTTVPAHLPDAHRRHLEWTPGRLLSWGQSIGPGTRDVIAWQLDHKPHPEQGYRACLGLLNLSKRYGKDRLEAACRRALALAAPHRKTIQSILNAKLDQMPDLFATADPSPPTPTQHANLRGPGYFSVTTKGDSPTC
jgi:transposase